MPSHSPLLLLIIIYYLILIIWDLWSISVGVRKHFYLPVAPNCSTLHCFPDEIYSKLQKSREKNDIVLSSGIPSPLTIGFPPVQIFVINYIRAPVNVSPVSLLLG